MSYPWAAGDELKAADLNAVVFGGDGSDGALSISSGTTQIDLAGAALVIKNYTSISITGTAKLEFINPHAGGSIVILKSQGNVTITSSTTPAIDLRSLGGTAGTGGAAGTSYIGGGTNATDGTDANSTFNQIIDGLTTHYGKKGTTSANGAATSPWSLYWHGMKIPPPGMGGGGGSGGGDGDGGAQGGDGAAGGRGGGTLLIECAGNLNLTSTLDATGANGSNGGNGTNPSNLNHDYAGSGGAGGAGGGGSILIAVFGTITYSGSILVTGGTGGTGGTTPTGVNGGSVNGDGTPGKGGSGGAGALTGGTAGGVLHNGGNGGGGGGGEGGNGISQIFKVRL